MKRPKPNAAPPALAIATLGEITPEQRRIIGDFTSRAITDEEAGKIFTINALACDFSLAVNELVPSGREKNKALQLIRAVAFWAAEGIAKNATQIQPDARPTLKVKASPDEPTTSSRPRRDRKPQSPDATAVAPEAPAPGAGDGARPRRPARRRRSD